MIVTRPDSFKRALPKLFSYPTHPFKEVFLNFFPTRLILFPNHPPTHPTPVSSCRSLTLSRGSKLLHSEVNPGHYPASQAANSLLAPPRQTGNAVATRLEKQERGSKGRQFR
jgi:hypothetical protein